MFENFSSNTWKTYSKKLDLVFVLLVGKETVVTQIIVQQTPSFLRVPCNESAQFTPKMHQNLKSERLRENLKNLISRFSKKVTKWAKQVFASLPRETQNRFLKQLLAILGMHRSLGCRQPHLPCKFEGPRNFNLFSSVPGANLRRNWEQSFGRNKLH